MRRRLQTLLVTAAALILVVQHLSVRELNAQTNDTQPEEQLDAVNQAISRIEQWLGAAENTLSTQEQSLRQLGRDMESRETRIRSNQEQILALENELAGLRERENRLEQDITQQQALVGEAVRASWMTGRDSMLKLLLNQQDPAQINRMLHYYDHFNSARLQQINRYRDTLLALDDTRDDIARNRSSLEQQTAGLERELAALADDARQRQVLIAELEAEMAARGGELEQLTQDREHLEALIEEINRIIVDIPPPEDLLPFAESRGQLPWPVAGRPLNRFGATYSDGNMIRQGIIIAAAEGTPVRAVHHGRVVFADWLRGSGLLVVVDHGGGYITLYAHNQALDKQSGDWVNRGEPVATAGSNAGMNSPGVYFELRHNGTPRDPVQWLVPQ